MKSVLNILLATFALAGLAVAIVVLAWWDSMYTVGLSKDALAVFGTAATLWICATLWTASRMFKRKANNA